MSRVEELGKCWVDLNCWKWNDLLNPKPQGFDEMGMDEKSKHIEPYMKELESLIGKYSAHITSFCWWKYELNKSAEEWVEWRFLEDNLL